jgi:murein DD-endopeptidase MepM/ murein hydrolase activator NlpD
VIKVAGAEISQPPSASFNGKQFYFSSCGEGCFIAIGAADLKTKPGIRKVKVRIGKKKKNLRVVVKRTTFPILRLTLPEEKVILNQEDLARAKDENKRLKSICGIVSDRLWEGSFVLPLGSDISTAFGTKRIFNSKMISRHMGVDLKGQEGEEIRASNRGKVVLAEETFFGGNTVILDHGQGIYTIYMHLSKFEVNPPDVVSKGGVIGLVGSTGRASGPHLHFGVKVMNINTNPIAFAELAL